MNLRMRMRLLGWVCVGDANRAEEALQQTGRPYPSGAEPAEMLERGRAPS
jgi:hypothetical protein